MELSEDDGYGMTMIYVDHFSKIVVLVPLKESDAWTVANCFVAEVLNHQRLLSAITSDRDPRL